MVQQLYEYYFRRFNKSFDNNNIDNFSPILFYLRIFEKNGVIKRNEIDDIVKLIPSQERKKLWNMGVKIGRYHIYLPKMLKPKAVEFRISLWKIFYNLTKNQIPKSGLNFLTSL